MRFLIVKLSSLGDIVHAMPAAQLMRRVFPLARIEWLVEPGFAALVNRVSGIDDVIAAPLRRWRSAWWSSSARAEMRRLKERLTATPFDAVLDLQGLTKSAVLARLAPLSPGGHRYGLGNRTDGAGWEWPSRWLVDRPIMIEPHVHVVDRSLLLVSKALGIALGGPVVYGLHGAKAAASKAPTAAPLVIFVHGSSRDDKLWPAAHWIALGKRVLAQGWRIALPQSDESEQTRAELIAAALQFERAPMVEVWPAMGLGAVIDRMAAAQGVIGVDSGLSHIAVALDLPHVQIYNFPTAWRTGPLAAHGHRHQVAVEGGPVPSIDTVWSAWQGVMPSLATGRP